MALASMDHRHNDQDDEQLQLGRSAGERSLLMAGAAFALLALLLPPLLMAMGVLQQQLTPRQEPQAGQLS